MQNNEPGVESQGGFPGAKIQKQFYKGKAPGKRLQETCCFFPRIEKETRNSFLCVSSIVTFCNINHRWLSQGQNHRDGSPVPSRTEYKGPMVTVLFLVSLSRIRSHVGARGPSLWILRSLFLFTQAASSGFSHCHSQGPPLSLHHRLDGLFLRPSPSRRLLQKALCPALPFE